MPVVNGKNSNGELFETGSKTYLIEQGSYNGKDYVDMRLLYEDDNGQLARTTKAARVDLNDLAEFIDTVIRVSQLPIMLIQDDHNP